jgi:hypothetical protein
MKKHAILSMKIILVFILLFSITFHGNAQQRNLDWLLIYYLPYDNNLSPLADAIIDQFTAAKTNGKVCIVLQSDLAGPGGMTRYVVDGKVDSAQLTDDNSGTYAGFRNYLTWVSDNFKAKHYAIVLLNHGGLVNEYGVDEYPAEQWIGIDSLAVAIRDFNSKEGISKVDLLFEQVCARGTIENLYEFKDVAHFSLASQGLVPAPGYYFTSAFDNLDDGKIKNGVQLADLIVACERRDMYYSYTLIDNSQWKKWMTVFDAYVASFEEKETMVISDSLKVFTYWGGLYYDIESILEGTRGKNSELAFALKNFTKDQLIRRHYMNLHVDTMHGYSGLSVFSAFKPLDSPLALFQVGSYKRWRHMLRKGMRGN